MAERKITFEHGEGQMNLDDELTEREEQKAELLDSAEAGWLHGGNQNSNRRMNIRQAVDATYADVSAIEATDTQTSYLWQTIKSRFPEKSERSVLVDAYLDNFIPNVHKERTPIWEKEQKHTISWKEEERLAALGSEIDSAEKLVAFIRLAEQGQEAADLANSQREQEKLSIENFKRVEKEKAEALAIHFGLLEFKVERVGREPVIHELPEFAAKLGHYLETLPAETSEEQRHSIEKGLETLIFQLRKSFPSKKDRGLLLGKIKGNDLQAGLSYDKLIAQHALHEPTEETRREEAELLTAYHTAHRIALAVEEAIRLSD